MSNQETDMLQEDTANEANQRDKVCCVLINCLTAGANISAWLWFYLGNAFTAAVASTTLVFTPAALMYLAYQVKQTQKHHSSPHTHGSTFISEHGTLLTATLYLTASVSLATSTSLLLLSTGLIKTIPLLSLTALTTISAITSGAALILALGALLLLRHHQHKVQWAESHTLHEPSTRERYCPEKHYIPT
jgi:hypothetical protein